MDTFLAVACMLQSRAINRSWAEKFLIILNLMKCFFLFYFFISELFHFEGTDWSKCETYSITVALLSQSWLHDRQVRYLLCKCRPCSIALPNEEGGWACVGLKVLPIAHSFILWNVIFLMRVTM